MVQIDNSQNRFSNISIKSISDELSIDDLKSGHCKTSSQSGQHECSEVPLLSAKSHTYPGQHHQDSDSSDSVKLHFLRPPPKHRKLKRKKKKSIEKCTKPNPRKGSVKTIDSIPASIPEENSEDVISSDPDIETVEYVKNRELEESNQNTVHSIHQIFSELDELVFDQGENVWEEKARWIKFEQDIHRGADKWGKPHVATLKLQSIISLRKCIAQGTVLLGMKAFNLESVIEMTLDRLVSRALITSSVAVQLRTLLLKRHVHTGEHQHEGVFRYRKGKFKHGFLAGISEGFSPEISPSASRMNSRANSEQDLVKMKQHFLRKLPPDTEASNVMIGKLDYLETNICVTIRLSHSILLGDITEVPIPTRFIFLLLCPDCSRIDHVEVGRAASTLFSDEMFYKAAYSAEGKSDLIQGIDKFLEKAIVIPPSEWDPKMKITMPEEEESGEEEEADLGSGQVEALHSHVMPCGGLLCDIKALRLRWVTDCKRGAQLLPLLVPLQFSVQLLCHTLLILQLALPHFTYPVALTLGAVGGMGVVTSLAACQPLIVSSASLPVVLWEMAISALCSRMGLSYRRVRPLLGVLSGLLLVLSSVLNAGNFLPGVSVFVYETVITALPLSLLVTVFLILLKMRQESQILLCSAVLLLLTVVFLKICQAVTHSTIFTKKIRTVLKSVNLLSLIVLVALLVRYTTLTTSPYHPRNSAGLPHNTSTTVDNTSTTVDNTSTTVDNTSTTVDNTSTTVDNTSTTVDNTSTTVDNTSTTVDNTSTTVDNTQHHPSDYPLFPADVAHISVAIVAGVSLTFLAVLMLGIVHSWVVQPNHRVRRFSGRFWDQCIVGIGVVISGVFGLPFLIPDIVLTPILLHLLSLPSVANKDTLHVKEQRVTLTLSSIVVVVSSFTAPYLHCYVPLPLCWGVILFYSFYGLRHTQLFERCKILLQSEKYHPEKSYVANTPQKVINSYTVVQIVLMFVLVVVMVTPYTCCALPLFLLLLILLRRHLLPLVMFEDLISLLEESSSPVAVPCEFPSISNKAEFSEEVSKIRIECSDTADELPADHITFPPQIIFDNLTDDDTLCVRGTREGPADEPVTSPPVVLTVEQDQEQFLDFLCYRDQSKSIISCPLPFQQDDPVRSEEPFTSTFLDQPGFILPD